MADYTLIKINGNTNTDASPTWTNATIRFAGTGGANEMRWASTAAGATTSTSSANWPYTTRPTSGTAAVEQLYFFTTGDTTGYQVATYDGGRTYARVIQIDHDNTGTFASAPRFSAFADNTHSAPSPGTQLANASDGRNIVNGQASDTGSNSYLKANAYGSGLTAGSVQETPNAGNVGTTLAVTSGTAGAATPGAGAWLATWQSLQGWTQYIVAPAVPAATTAYDWYISMALYMGANMLPGTFVFAPLTYDYTYS